MKLIVLPWKKRDLDVDGDILIWRPIMNVAKYVDSYHAAYIDLYNNGYVRLTVFYLENIKSTGFTSKVYNLPFETPEEEAKKFADEKLIELGFQLLDEKLNAFL